MIDGFYSALFETPLGTGGGVVVLSGGTVRGGDSMMFYTGHYSVSGEHMSATVRTGTHFNAPGQQSVFGVSSATLSLQGKVAGGKIIATGTAAEVPGIKMTLTLNRLGD